MNPLDDVSDEAGTARRVSAMPGSHGPDLCSGRLQANRLLALLPVECQRLQSELQLTRLSHGEVLVDAGSVPSHVYFPTTRRSH